LRYVRGDRKINVDMNLQMRNNRRGSLSVSVETPFELIRTLTLNANWRNGKGSVSYNRNNVTYNFEGSFNVKVDGTSFEISFVPDSGQPIKVAFDYNAGAIIQGNTDSPQNIAKLELAMLGKSMSFDLKGHRNSEKLYIEFEAESNFEQLRQIEFKLESELNTTKRAGLLEIKLNEFYFKVRNSFERKPSNGYYAKTEFDSNLTSLPGLIIGIGRENERRTLTIGSGDREISVSFEPKDGLRKGFAGAVSLPHRGINDAQFDVNYKFSSANELDIDASVQLEAGKAINVAVIYNADGVQARLSSPMGSHRARARRSISDNSFSGEISLDDYNISLRGERLVTENKLGFKIEGDSMGKRIAIDALYQREGAYNEGKFMVDTNIPVAQTFGVEFTGTDSAEKFARSTRILLPKVINSEPIIFKLSSSQNVFQVNAKIFTTTHRFYFERDFQNGVKSTIIVSSSPLFDGRYVFNIESNVFDFKRGLTKILKTSLSIYGGYSGSVALVVDMNNGTTTLLTVSTEQGTYTLETSLKSTDNEINVGIKASCPINAHELKLAITQDAVGQSNKVITINAVASSPLLAHNVHSTMKIELGQEKNMVDLSVNFDDKIHRIIFGYSYLSNGADMTLEIETPIFDIKKISVNSSLMIDSDIQANAKVIYFGVDHTFEFNLKRADKSFTSVISSPLITGEIVMIKGSIVGSSPSNMEILSSLNFDGRSVAAKLSLNFISFRNVSSHLEIKTPFHGYRKMNYVISFNNHENIKAMFTGDGPIDFKLEMETGKTTDSYKTMINIETPMIGYEKITLAGEVPLNVIGAKIMIQLPSSEYGLDFELENEQFAKQIGGNLMINGSKIGGGFGLRYKAPYQLGYFYNVPWVHGTGGFHLMMDSTMFQLLFPFV